MRSPGPGGTGSVAAIGTWLQLRFGLLVARLTTMNPLGRSSTTNGEPPCAKFAVVPAVPLFVTVIVKYTLGANGMALFTTTVLPFMLMLPVLPAPVNTEAVFVIASSGQNGVLDAVLFA